MTKNFILSKRAVDQLAAKYGTPLLVLSEERIKQNYDFLANCLPGVKLHYAVKANPDEQILRVLAGLGAHYDVASDGEIELLSRLGIPGERMVYANPVKTQSGLAAARRAGVNRFTFDSKSEIIKMAKSLPGGKFLLRLRLDNPGALVDLNRKFGVQPDEALELMLMAREYGLDVAGLCFHVGSQNADAEKYIQALTVCRDLFDEGKAAGLDLRILDIGGGFPIPTLTQEIDINSMLSEIRQGLAEYFPSTEIWAEPGRFLCGTAVNLITSVIGSQRRNGQQWYYLDDGLYGTFSGVIFDHWDFELLSFKNDPPIVATFAGPSCDSMDIMFKDRLTPVLHIDDLLLVPNCGAYTSTSATDFNGFRRTPVVIWEEEKIMV